MWVRDLNVSLKGMSRFRVQEKGNLKKKKPRGKRGPGSTGENEGTSKFMKERKEASTKTKKKPKKKRTFLTQGGELIIRLGRSPRKKKNQKENKKNLFSGGIR